MKVHVFCSKGGEPAGQPLELLEGGSKLVKPLAA